MSLVCHHIENHPLRCSWKIPLAATLWLASFAPLLTRRTWSLRASLLWDLEWLVATWSSQYHSRRALTWTLKYFDCKKCLRAFRQSWARWGPRGKMVTWMRSTRSLRGISLWVIWGSFRKQKIICLRIDTILLWRNSTNFKLKTFVASWFGKWPLESIKSQLCTTFRSSTSIRRWPQSCRNWQASSILVDLRMSLKWLSNKW